MIFLHYYGTGRAAKLAEAVRSAIDLLGKSQTRQSPAVLFMCPHGAAKSVLASAYFQRLAKERGLNVRVLSGGTDPDPAIAPAVARHLAMNGYEVPTAKPRMATRTDIEDADVVVSLGCDLTNLPVPPGKLKEWNDVPAPSEDFTAADEAIKKRVAELVEELIQAAKTP